MGVPAVLAGFAVYKGVSGYLAAGKEADATEALGRYQAGVLRQNALLAEQQALDSLQRGDLEARRQAAEGRQVIGTTRAGYAAQGVALESGSVADVLQQDAMLSAVDEATIRIWSRACAGAARLAAATTAKARMLHFI